MAALLLAAGLALPWYGWEGLHTVAPGIGLLGAGMLAATRWWRPASLVALLLAVAATALLIWRLQTPLPVLIYIPSARSQGGLDLCLAGAVGLALSAAVALRFPPPTRRLPSLGAEQRLAVAAAWRAGWTSRLLVWGAGVLGALELPPAVSHAVWIYRPLGAFGNLLIAPSSAWDAGNYLFVAQGGYGALPQLRAFFPLYPILIRATAWSPAAAVVSGILLSLAAFLVALYLLHRLMMLERRREESDLLVMLVAFFPMAFFFSAVYTESLFLALSVGSIYAARRGWWARAGVTGALAAATRVTGALLILPVLVLYLYGPREDRGPRRGGWRQPYRLEPSFAAVALVPLGLLAYLGYAGFHGGFLGPFHAEHTYWYRSFALGGGAVHGVLDAIRSVRQIIAGPHSHILAPVPFGQLSDPMRLAAVDLVDFGFFGFGCVAVIGALRTLPVAYGLYGAAVLLLEVSSFPPHEPLESLPRFILTLFPCLMWLALWAARRQRRAVFLALSAGSLAYFTAQFAALYWVA